MKVSIDWLKELVDLKISVQELTDLIPLRVQGGIKEVTENYLELDLKGYNRADLLSLRGVAYEVAAITDSKVKFQDGEAELPKELPELKVEVENSKLCPVYCLVKIEGLKVEPSSKEWVKKLADSETRSVNNIADVTNLVMLEYGQPLHAFDAKAVKNETIIVRTAKEGEKIITLDNKTRDLEEGDLLIADPQNALGIAGVMGGKDSEVSDSTETILLEAAIFDPIALRKTATRLGLQSEASKRFYHGLTARRLYQALEATIKMYQDLGGKVTGFIKVGEIKDQVKKIQLRQEKVNSLIGVDIPEEEVRRYLESLGLKGSGEGVWEVPYFRLDINIEEDLVEEVARMYGYERIPSKELKGELPERIDQTLFNLINKLKTEFVQLGLTEVQTYSFYSTQVLNSFNYPKNQLIKVANPISAETEYLRDHLWPNLVEVIAKNFKQGFSDIAIFEVGKVYYPTQDGQLMEEYRVALGLLNVTDNPIAELAQILKRVAEELKIDISIGEPIGQSEGRFHPNRYAFLNFNDQPIGKIGEVHPRCIDKIGLNQRVSILELNLAALNVN